MRMDDILDYVIFIIEGETLSLFFFFYIWKDVLNLLQY